jgi:hypothetical protein
LNEISKKIITMRQSINEKRNTATLANGIQKENVREAEKFTSISNSESQAFSVRQLFVVEWQMQRADFKPLNDKSLKNGVFST